MDIGIILYEGCIPSGCFAFADKLEIANRRLGKPLFKVHWLAPVPGEHNFQLNHTTPTIRMELEDLDRTKVDGLLIPGMWVTSPAELEQSITAKQTLIHVLRKMPNTLPMYGYCTAVALLAKAGRLNQHHATSTWWITEHLTSNYDQVEWTFDKTIVETKNGMTASGLHGYLPIALALIKNYCGEQVEREVTRLMVLPKPELHPSPFADLEPLNLEDDLLRQLILRIENTPANQATNSHIATQLNMSERNLARQVKGKSAKTLKAFIRLVKLKQASELLIFTQSPIGSIAQKIGFSDEPTFRKSFKRTTGYPPGKYREVFSRSP